MKDEFEHFDTAFATSGDGGNEGELTREREREEGEKDLEGDFDADFENQEVFAVTPDLIIDVDEAEQTQNM